MRPPVIARLGNMLLLVCAATVATVGPAQAAASKSAVVRLGFSSPAAYAPEGCLLP